LAPRPGRGGDKGALVPRGQGRKRGGKKGTKWKKKGGGGANAQFLAGLTKGDKIAGADVIRTGGEGKKWREGGKKEREEGEASERPPVDGKKKKTGAVVNFHSLNNQNEEKKPMFKKALEKKNTEAFFPWSRPKRAPRPQKNTKGKISGKKKKREDRSPANLKEEVRPPSIGRERGKEKRWSTPDRLGEEKRGNSL